MILLNFSHPITDLQIGQVRALTGAETVQVIDLPVQFDVQRPFEPQLHDLLARLPVSPAKMQGEPMLLNLPSLNYIAAMLLAVLRLRPVAGSVPTRFEVAEIVDLQGLRDSARAMRQGAQV